MSIFRATSYVFLASTLALIINNLVGFGLIRMLPPNQYGHIAYFLGVFALLRLIATLRLDPYVIDEISRYTTRATPEKITIVIYTIGGVRTALALGVLIFSSLLYFAQDQSVFLWAGLTTCTASFYDYMLATMQGLKRYRWILLLYTGQALLYLIVIILLYSMDYLQPDYIYASFALSFAIPAIMVGGIVLQQFKAQIHISKVYFQQSMQVVIPLFLVGIWNQVYLSQGVFWLGFWGHLDETAYFGTAFSLVGLPLNIGFAVAASTYYPELVSAHARQDHMQVAQLTYEFLRAFFFLLIIPTAIAISFGDVIITLLYTETYSGSIMPFRIMSPLIILLFVQQFAIFLLYTYARLKIAIWVMAIQALLTIAGTLLSIRLAPNSAAVGTAISALVGVSIGVGLLWRFGHQYAPLPYQKWLGVGGSVIGLTMSVRYVADLVSSPLVLFSSIALASLMAALLALFLLFSATERRMFQRKISAWIGQHNTA